MIQFKDFFGNDVKLSFEYLPFSKSPKHVWVICRYQEQWLLTNHKSRGLEFPGGKVESGESPEDAAYREVLEETGGVVSELHYIGQYHVEGKTETIIKNIYYAKVSTLLNRETFFETNGPQLIKQLPSDIKRNNEFSFIMKDMVLQESLKQIEKLLF